MSTAFYSRVKAPTCKWGILGILVRGKITVASVSGPVEPCLPAGFNWDPRPQQIHGEGRGSEGEGLGESGVVTTLSQEELGRCLRTLLLRSLLQSWK